MNGSSRTVVEVRRRSRGTSAAGSAASHLAMITAGGLTACSRSPSQDIFGSFFPSWLLCLCCGVVAAVLLRAVLFAVGLGEYVLAPLIAYPAVAISVTLMIWLVQFAN